MANNSQGIKLPSKAQEKLLAYCKRILETHQDFTDIRTKMEAIDVAYARYQTAEGAEREACGNQQMPDPLGRDRIVAPIVVSQVDSYSAYLSDVFLSGSPIFPVVSTPANRKYAEQLETLIDDHATIGGYARQMLLFIKNAVKYNIGALEADWDGLEQLSVTNTFLDPTGSKIETMDRYITKIKNLDMYNTFWDLSVAPADVSAEGDFAGYIEPLTQTKLFRLVRKLEAQGIAYNVDKALSSCRNNVAAQQNKMYVKPCISDYVGSRRSRHDWDVFFGDKDRPYNSGGHIGELQVLYLRIVPKDFGIIAPLADKMQIWQVRILNGEMILSARRIISAYNRLPILLGQPLEDGMDYQTQSVAEMQIPIQKAATTLLNIRFAAARRAVSDRAIYNPQIISHKHVNNPGAAPKIPANINPLSNQRLADAYYPIPFDMRGTDSTIGDAAYLVNFSQQLSGINAPMQGQFQKGNKSVQEWQDTMGGADSRLRMAALCLEHQVFIWLKFILVLNIYQYGENAQVVSQRTGEAMDIDINQLRQKVLAFRIADGYNPKAKLASTDMLTAGMQMLMNSPILQQAYGTSLPSMFAHLMQLGGVRGLDEYDPARQAQEGQMTPDEQAMQQMLMSAQAGQAGPVPGVQDPMAQQVPPGVVV